MAIRTGDVTLIREKEREIVNANSREKTERLESEYSFNKINERNNMGRNFRFVLQEKQPNMFRIIIYYGEENFITMNGCD